LVFDLRGETRKIGIALSRTRTPSFASDFEASNEANESVHRAFGDVNSTRATQGNIVLIGENLIE